MCGITGILHLDRDRPVDERLLKAMNDDIAHRGPDGDGLFFDPGIGLGHRRLSIIDLSGGKQPLFNEDESVVVTFNGEIYNFQELARELQLAGHRFRTHSDTEVIVHAWEQWGPDCVRRFRGMFAFAIWDRRQETLFVARDRLGKKPLYYVYQDGLFAFASELKSLLRLPGLSREIDPQAVEDYFGLGYVPEPRSILRSVRKLEAAHTVELRRGGAGQPTFREYWDLPTEPVADPTRATDTAALIEQLRDAVNVRLISEVPLGAFLSGGVDSSAVVAMMAQVSDKPVNTCSISFADPRYDEARYAKMVAERYRTTHFVDVVESDDFDLVDKLAHVYDEPFADSSAIPTYRVCELARRHVTVALSGDGGDEAFAGYRRYRWHMKEEGVRGLLPLALRRPLFGLLGRAYPKLDWAPRWLRAKSTFQSLALDPVGAYFNTVSVIPDYIRDGLFSREFRRTLGGYSAHEVLRRRAQKVPRLDPLSAVQYIDFKTYLCGDILTKVDRASMAHSLEVRVPMLDHQFLEWASTVPASAKLHEGEGKWLLKKSLEPHLPHDVLYRDKMGFAVPISSWFRGPLRDRVRELASGPALRGTGYFEDGAIDRLVREHVSGMREHSAAIWALLMFEASMRNVLQRS